MGCCFVSLMADLDSTLKSLQCSTIELVLQGINKIQHEKIYKRFSCMRCHAFEHGDLSLFEISALEN